MCVWGGEAGGRKRACTTSWGSFLNQEMRIMLCCYDAGGGGGGGFSSVQDGIYALLKVHY